MTQHAFDALTRSVATRVTRRRALQAAGATGVGLAAGFGLARTIAQEPSAEPAPGATPPAVVPGRTSFLFVQTFGAGTLNPHPTDPALYTLTLTGHAAETIYFSDRPERIVGSVPTTGFLDNLGFSPDNPPNAALVAGEQVIVLELLNPVYTESFGRDGTVTLTYDVAVLADYAGEGLAHLALQANGDLPQSFASASLFIDDCPDIYRIDCKPIYQYNVGLLHNSNGGRNDPIGQCWGGPINYCQPCDRGYGWGWDGIAKECNARFPDACRETGCIGVAGL